MRVSSWIVALGLAVAAVPLAPPAEASRGDGRSELRSGNAPRAGTARTASARPANRAPRGDWGGISCVPYARSVTGMAISGNGRDWWHNAAGRYARGQRPEPGSVLAFPGSGGMRSGHVAVVSRVVHDRMILIDHANWGGPGIRRGSVMRGVQVIDVSHDNSWTRVRVQVGWTAGDFGREYPTYGFIHNRPASTYAAIEDAALVRPAAYFRPAAARPARSAPPRAAAPARAQAPRGQAPRAQAQRAQAPRASAQPVRVAEARPPRR